MKLLYTGGGTLGPVTALLAVHEALLSEKTYESVWIGTQNGPEKKIIEEAGISFYTIRSGKLRRYFSLQNISDIANVLIGIGQAIGVLREHKPDCIVAAAGYVSVPVVLAGKLLGIPSVIHQQDVYPSLTNTILAPFATKITASFALSAQHFKKYHEKFEFTGHPVRPDLMQGKATLAQKKFTLDEKIPVILVTGGGTGAQAINDLITKALPQLLEKAQIIHITGMGRCSHKAKLNAIQKKRYHAVTLLTEGMADVLAVADVVISRGGAGTTQEIAALGKSSILIPMPNTHQEYNTNVFKKSRAAFVRDQQSYTVEQLLFDIDILLNDKNKQKQLQKNLQSLYKPGVQNIVAVIKSCLN